MESVEDVQAQNNITPLQSSGNHIAATIFRSAAYRHTSNFVILMLTRAIADLHCDRFAKEGFIRHFEEIIKDPRDTLTGGSSLFNHCHCLNSFSFFFLFLSRQR